jgi:hypothetical protein
MSHPPKPKAAEAPFVRFLRTHPDAPRVEWDPPAKAMGFYQRAGYDHPRGWSPSHGKRIYEVGSRAPGYVRVLPLIKAWTRLSLWLRSSQAFVAPPTWPGTVARVMPSHVTPFDFEVGCFPDQGLVPRTLRKDDTLGWGVACLSAYAKGWPVDATFYPAMAEATERLQEFVPFLLWAYPVEIDCLALPDDPSGSMRNFGARGILATNPLAANTKDLKLGLPAWARNRRYLLTLPPRPFDASRSSRQPLLAAASCVHRQQSWTAHR